ncbi:type II toxin-antitoxin system death-on-curing family toxin [Pontibacter sp. 172403-2]|uniref:type II toxin-antitoxin system death-on-curing family toxin n=1 Tax=Pontibacter rufus TaxID=2791028 RepID=UPI0018AFB765|nr:type II toxin-antitoxin system death-on-curing family toxin [Pontibacter sp. 172403-2]MBF9254316.1 type II toxin-antitoxin system death-on-curing family toxin [Pontibacter sp. 172403-2]
MISIKEVEQIHDLLIEEFGGAKGIRDFGALDAAINRPFATFGQQELYPTPAGKAAAVIESILINHPFIDGNKRTGYVLMRLLLLQSGQDIKAEQEEKYDFVISIATGRLTFDGIKDWIEKKLHK